MCKKVLDSNACLEHIESQIDEVKVEVGKHEHIKKKIDGMKTEAMAWSMSIPQVIKKVYEKAEANTKDEHEEIQYSCYQLSRITS